MLRKDISNCTIVHVAEFSYASILLKEERFHLAATPLKPYKVGNICYMTYWYSVLNFLNLSLKHFFSTENANFCENIKIRRPLSFRVLTRSHMPNRRFSQSKIEDIVHLSLIHI